MAEYPPEVPMDNVIVPSPESSSEIAYTGSFTVDIAMFGLALFVIGLILFIIMVATSKRPE